MTSIIHLKNFSYFDHRKRDKKQDMLLNFDFNVMKEKITRHGLRHERCWTEIFLNAYVWKKILKSEIHSCFVFHFKSLFKIVFVLGRFPIQLIHMSSNRCKAFFRNRPTPNQKETFRVNKSCKHWKLVDVMSSIKNDITDS